MNTTKMMVLAASVTALGCSSASVRAAQEKLTVQTYTAADAGFDVNSHLILGEKDAILVDAQFTRSEARNVVAKVKASGRNLKTIFITHGHPDHYLGLEVLSKEFPNAAIVATPAVIEDIKKTAPGKIAYWKTMYKDDLADTFVTPKALKGNSLELEGETIQVAEMAEGESEHAAVLYIPSIKTLVAGDVAYNRVHLWLAENRPEGWLKNLETVRAMGPIEAVLPGHGAAGDAAVLEDDASYIRTFVKDTAQPATKDTAIAAMKGKYSDYSLPVILELSVGARVK